MRNRYTAALILLVVSLAVLAPSAPARERKKLAETQKLYLACTEKCSDEYDDAKKACEEKPKEERAECKRKAREDYDACKASCLG